MEKTKTKPTATSGRDNRGRFTKGNKIGNRFSNREAAEYGAKGGRNAAAPLKAFRTMYERAKEISAQVMAKDKDGNEYDMLDVAIKKQLELAAKGDTDAYKAVMKTLREDVQKVALENVPIVIDYTEQPEDED